MASSKPGIGFGIAYPHIDRWVSDRGCWIELGADEYSSSFIRVLDPGGVVWEGKDDYPSVDAAFKAADDAIAAEFGPEPPARRSSSKSQKKTPAKPKLTPVESSMISTVGYDAATKELIAVFNSGATWRYRNVPKRVYQELLRSGSKGSYMRSCVIGEYSDYQVRG